MIKITNKLKIVIISIIVENTPQQRQWKYLPYSSSCYTLSILIVVHNVKLSTDYARHNESLEM